MKISRITASAQLSTSGAPTRTRVTGSLQIGAQTSQVSYDPLLYNSYARKVIIYDTADTGEIDIATSTIAAFTTYVPAVAQSHKVVASGTVTTAGTLFVKITSSVYSALPLSTKTVTLTLTGTPSATSWANSVRLALNADSTVSSNFVVSGTGTDIILTRLIDDGGVVNDGTFNIALDAGTVIGTDDVTTSTSLAVGSVAEGVLWDEVDEVDEEGFPLPTFEAYTSGILINCVRGEGTVSDGGSLVVPMKKDGILLLSNSTGVNQGFDTSIIIEATSVPYEIVLQLTNKIA